MSLICRNEGVGSDRKTRANMIEDVCRERRRRCLESEETKFKWPAKESFMNEVVWLLLLH